MEHVLVPYLFYMIKIVHIIYLAQTPQAFKFGIIFDCFIKSYEMIIKFFKDNSKQMNHYAMPTSEE